MISTPTPIRRSPRATAAAAAVRPEPAGPETSSSCGPVPKKSMPTVSASGPPTPSGSQVPDGGESGTRRSSMVTWVGSAGNACGSPATVGSMPENRAATWVISVSASTSGRQIWMCVPVAASTARPGISGGLAVVDARCARRSSSLPNGRSRRRLNSVATLLVNSS